MSVPVSSISHKDQSPPPSSPPRATTASREPTPAPDASDVAPDDKPADGEIIEMDTLAQILDLDEDDTREFSKGMARAYFSQANQTFKEMDDAYAADDLAKLSSLGHFLKGSSAALGVSKVQASCEQVQHYGDLRDEDMDSDLTPAQALAKIGVTLKRVKLEYAAAEKWLKEYFGGLDAAGDGVVDRGARGDPEP